MREEVMTKQGGKAVDLKMEGGKRGPDMMMVGVITGQGTVEGRRGPGSVIQEI